MLTLGADVFLLDPAAARGSDLVTGDVVEVYSERCAIVVDTPDYHPDPGTMVIIFYTFGRGFFRQEARIRETLATGDSVMVRLSLIDSSETADRRGEFRTSTILENLHPTIQGQQDGMIADISEQGLSVIVSGEVADSDEMQVEFEIHGERFSGTALVQNRRSQPDGRVRCGLRIDPGTSRTATLRLGLLRLSIDLQRDLLRRMQRRAS